VSILTISIDPGASGSIAWQDTDGRVYADPMPPNMTEIYDYLKNLIVHVDPRAIVEAVGAYMTGNSGPAAAKFARHCGHIDAILYALKIPSETVSPQKWQKPMNLPKDKQERKNAIKEAMQRRFPDLKVTLKTADALAILCWYLNQHG